MERGQRQSTPVGTGRVPWLVFTGPDDQTFCTIGTTSTTFELKCIPELYNNEFRVCYHGWLLLSTKDYHLWSLWNPKTYYLINLPPLPLELINNMNIGSCVFTTSPKNAGCTIALFDFSSTNMAYCQPGDQDWTTHDYRRNLLEAGVEESRVATLRSFTCLDGVIYADDGLYSQMVAIEFDNQTRHIKLRSLGLGRPWWRICTLCVRTFLVESFGEIYSVHVQMRINWEEIFSIEVFRLDFSRKDWVEVENLNGILIFLDSQGNYTSCLAMETGIRGNQIYYTTPEDKHMNVYDLEDGLY